VPKDYQPKTERGRFFSSLANPAGNPARLELDTYMEDFFVFLYGDRKNNPGFDYKLIYADPPVETHESHSSD
jgi:hypothetical protein